MSQAAAHGQFAVVNGAAAWAPGLAGRARQLQPALELPLIDSVVAGAQQAMRLAGQRAASPIFRRGADWAGVSP